MQRIIKQTQIKMSQPQKLKTQQSLKSFTDRQETYHVIPATVNRNQTQGNESNVTNITQKNLSIINRTENQLPSIHDQPKSQKQIQKLPQTKKDQSKKSIENQNKKAQEKPKDHQVKKDVVKEEASKEKQNHQKPKEEKKQQVIKDNKELKQIKIDKKDQPKTVEKKEDTNKEKKEDTNKEKVPQIQKPLQNHKEENKTSVAKNNQSIQQKTQPKQTSTGSTIQQTKQTPIIQSKIEQKQIKVQDTSTEIPKKQQPKILETKQTKAQNIQKKKGQSTKPQQEIKKDEKEKVIQQKSQPKAQVQAQVQEKKIENKQQQKINQKNNQPKKALTDGIENKKHQKPQHKQKKQITLHDKQVIPKTENNNDKILNWNMLLKSFLERISKAKGRQQSLHKQEGYKNGQNVDNNKIDLNLQLGSSQISSQKDYENRIKLQFRVYDQVKNGDIKENKVVKSEKQLQQSNGVNDEKDNDNDDEKDVAKKSSPLKKNHKLNHPIGLSFSIYDLDSNKNQTSTNNNKLNSDKLRNKLQQITKNYDKNQFSFSINQQQKRGQSQSKKSQSKKSQIKKTKKTEINFFMSEDFISRELQINKNRLVAVKNLLQSQIVSQNKQKQKQKGNKKTPQQQQNHKHNNLISSTFCELSTTYPLKTIQPIKFLQFLLNGFKLRLFSENYHQKINIKQNYFQQVLYDVLLQLFPEQISQYVSKVSTGTGRIKFRSVDNLNKILTRLGVNQMLAETPTVKELLNELMGNVKGLFYVHNDNNKEGKQQDKQPREGQQKHNQSPEKKDKQQQPKDNTDDNNKRVSQLWKIFESIFEQSKSNGLEIQLRIFNHLGIRLVLECKSQTIKQLYQQLITN